MREVFYENDGSLLDYGKAPVAPVGDSPEEVLQILAWCRAAFDLPILSLEGIEEELAQRPRAEQSDARLSLHDVRAALALETRER